MLKSIEALPPGLYGMVIKEVAGKGGKPAYEVEFREHRLEEIVERLNRFKRKDEAAFEAVERVSDFNQKAYELLARPLLQATSNEAGAKLMREMHPLRAERWSLSDLNPWLAWLGPTAEAVREQRAALDSRVGAAADRAGHIGTDQRHAGLLPRGARCDQRGDVLPDFRVDVCADDGRGPARGHGRRCRARQREQGGGQQGARVDRGRRLCAAAVRIGALLARHGEPMPLERLALRKELMADYAGLMPDLDPATWRRLRGEQEVIVRHAPEQALATLPKLLASRDDRVRLLRLVDGLMNDPRIEGFKPTAEQRAMVDLLRAKLVRSTSTKRAAKRASAKRTTRGRRVAR